MQKILTIGLIFYIGFPFIGISQYNVPVFPSETGSELLNSVVTAYKPITVKEYGPARDILYGEVYLQNDSVEGIYSGHQVYLPQGVDPSTYIYQNGIPNGINAEHSYPQSKGASFNDGNAHSDMHHLFPARIRVNEARSSLPYTDIPDNQTTTWFYKTSEINGTPSSNKDAYSEQRFGAFEPRESVKGNIARAIFYFYTMYKAQADAADPNFFELQRPALCDWHFADPVDSLEWERTWQIAKYQNDKANPFILDCTLAARSFCAQTQGDCPTLPTLPVTTVEKELSPIAVYPNPSNGSITLNSHSDIKSYFLFDTQGFLVDSKQLEFAQKSANINIKSSASGTYRLVVELEQGFHSKTILILDSGN